MVHVPGWGMLDCIVLVGSASISCIATGCIGHYIMLEDLSMDSGDSLHAVIRGHLQRRQELFFTDFFL